MQFQHYTANWQTHDILRSISVSRSGQVQLFIGYLATLTGVDIVFFLQQIPTWVSLEIEDERRNFPKMSRAIPVVLGYIKLISGLNLNLCNLSMRCTCSLTKLTNRLDKWAQKQIDRLIELIKKQLYQRGTESIIYSNNYRQ